MSTDVTHRSERSRYEIRVDDAFAGIAAYEVSGGVTIFTHTVIQDDFEGRGLAGVLVDGAIADVAQRGGAFAATCPYVVHWLTKNHQHDAALTEVPEGFQA
ncbi:N-acetyltransferase [Serinibacter arcticus]|uniref:N-acetyltransferase n=1 Tax=Serinibacter arcticus TaxID=1655435 RepID=A0A2U1ZXX4_9MICO|nr:GNAT family N-acetyltransferase [Serinibacter arcticus]PWD51790.1 N-acetyltransferase [Serinibacter arcticus]